MTYRSFARVAPLLALVLVTGCSIDLQHGLTEQDANEIYVLLSKNGINATKVKEGEGQDMKFNIVVPKADAAQAAELLRSNSLPRPMEKGFNHFAKGSMVPTAAEERAMTLKALGGEVSNALNKIDGVLEANVIVNIPENNDLTQPENKPLPSSSVMIRYRPSLEGKAPLGEKEVKQFVASAVQDLKPENVTVLLTPALAPAAETNPESRLQDVFGLRMTAASASQFRVLVAVVSIFVLGMIALSAWVLMRGGSSGGAARPARARPPRSEA
ncbi:type III secretion protein [Hyalangium rubrum]|uniref:Type III secretion protein n=1 Tax=Hyalangium rubrum TaxID=3103134 RepID=A0ABU5GYG2_9BACT|nr:type III secretion protein [Hyalangium sp. s54d21]MDY7225538.1 type III secretion protein [Hyalangium sp. s54d21]